MAERKQAFNITQQRELVHGLGTKSVFWLGSEWVRMVDGEVEEKSQRKVYKGSWGG